MRQSNYVGPWTAQELDILTKNYATNPTRAVGKLIPNRTLEAIEQRAAKLGLVRHRAWTQEEIDVLSETYPHGADLVVLAARFDRPVKQIRAKVSILALRRNVQQIMHSKTWTTVRAHGYSILRNFTETEKHYLAGLFDGEGSIHFSNPIRSRSQTIRVVVTNTDESIIRWLLEKIPEGRIETKRPRPSVNRRTCYDFVLGTALGFKFCEEMIPYLIIKKPQAELVAANLSRGFSPLVMEERIQLRKLLSDLNKPPHVLLDNPSVTI